MSEGTKHLRPWIGLDMAKHPSRTTCFQLCRVPSGYQPAADGMPRGWVAVATVDMDENGEVKRFAAVPELAHRKLAIMRLARKWQRKSTPHEL